MFAAVRSSRRCVAHTAKWARAASTTPSAGATSSTATPETGVATTKSVPTTRRKKAASKPQIASPTTAALASTKNWKQLGLKYDPTTLPVKQTLDPNLAPFTEEDYAMTLIHGRSVHKPFFHPKTHGIPAAVIHFRSHHVRHLNLFTHFVTHAASSLKIPVSQVVMLPTQRRLWTVLRSPFAHKKSQENFERKVHKRAVKAWDADPEVIQRWIAYLRTHAMPGVGMKVITWERVPVGFGAGIKKKAAAPTPAKKIASLGKKIVNDETVGSGGARAAVATAE